MTKTISLSEEAYEALASAKRPGESFRKVARAHRHVDAPIPRWACVHRRRAVAAAIMALWTLFTVAVLVLSAFTQMPFEGAGPYVVAIALGVASSLLFLTARGPVAPVLAASATALVVVLAILARPTRYDDAGTWAYLLAPALAAIVGWEGRARAAAEAR